MFTVWSLHVIKYTGLELSFWPGIGCLVEMEYGKSLLNFYHCSQLILKVN